MPKEYTTIAVSREVKEVLATLKTKMGARNYDQVLRLLLQRAGYAVP
jgi:hypothetical protein